MFALTNRWQSLNIVSIMLLPFSILYCLIAVLRRWIYILGLLKKTRLPVPVIVVGNLTVGGTGKTPLVLWLSQWLTKHGESPCIVLRGYGGRSQTWPLSVYGNTSPILAGDEAVFLAQYSDCPVVAAPDRVAAAKKVIKENKCTIIISDDGLQHYRLARDYEIVVVDGQRRYGNGLCLPAGPLREPVWRARAAQLLIVNGPAASDKFGMTFQPRMFQNLKSGMTVRLDHFGHGPVHAIAGIGNPERFFRDLRAIKIKLHEHPFPDHWNFSLEDIDFEDGLPIIMTGKDAVKCQAFATEQHWFLQIQVKPSAETEAKIDSDLKEIING